MVNKSSKNALIKIDRQIYEKIKKAVEEDKVEFPSIKNFVEKAVSKILETDDKIKEKIAQMHSEKKGSSNGNNHPYKHVPSGVG